jgi:AraC-like DNA-binding protein
MVKTIDEIRIERLDSVFTIDEKSGEAAEIAAAAKTFPMTVIQNAPWSTDRDRIVEVKRLRLQEARGLMFGEGVDAAEAAFHVDYENPWQFSHEYRRMFGAPPRADVTALKLTRTLAVDTFNDGQKRGWLRQTHDRLGGHRGAVSVVPICDSTN